MIDQTIDAYRERVRSNRDREIAAVLDHALSSAPDLRAAIVQLRNNLDPSLDTGVAYRLGERAGRYDTNPFPEQSDAWHAWHDGRSDQSGRSY